MKTRFLTLAAFSALLAVASAQQPNGQAGNPPRPTLIIKRTVNPIFPHRLNEEGISEGSCRVAVSVDSSGKLGEYLVIGYTHPALVEPTINAIKQWEFEAPIWNGQPIAMQRDIEFRFENHGAVVTMDLQSYVGIMVNRVFPERFTYRPRTLKEIDRIPTPLNAESPAVPKSTQGEAVVEFFIDEQGNVRMPSILKADNDTVAEAATAAVRNWKFEAPTVNGKPVLVRAQQTFRFQP
ncbi:MAG TPA: TonB family protein [Opitutaceae bacterium]|nr:TonB family protein [Opitutaceae bacterium]